MGIIVPASGVRAGTVAHFAASTAPNGWLACNGAAVSRTLYGALFLAIGTTYGPGNGSTTFNLPDLRGEFIRGHDGGRGVDTGRAFGSAQAGEIQGHTHSTANIWQASGGSLGAVGGSSLAPATVTSQSTGGAETRPRNVALLACIKF